MFHLQKRESLALVCALLGPLVVTVCIVPFRTSFANTNAALLLVLVIVAVAALGVRFAGWMAALLAAVWFDFFLTQPYQQIVIDDRADVETALLLLLVGISVTEIAVWGRKQLEIASRETGYREGIRAAAEAVTAGRSAHSLIAAVSEQLTKMLDLESCRFEYGVAGLGHPARIRHDGRVEWRGTAWDAEGKDFPAHEAVELIAESGGHVQGRFLMEAKPNARPPVERRQVAVILASQVGASLR